MKLFERRRHQAELMVIGAMLGQGEMTTSQIAERTGLNPARAWCALQALEAAGRVSSRWQDGPYPRRRLYRYAFAKGGVIRASGSHYSPAGCEQIVARRNAPDREDTP